MHSLRSWTRVALTFGGLLAAVAVVEAAEPGVTSQVERAASASVDEMQESTPTWLEEMRENVRSLAKLDDLAKKRTDGEGIPCVTNNLAAARSLVQVSEAAERQLDQAVSEGRLERARSEYRKLAVAIDKSRRRLAEGERCAFGEGLQAGKTRVMVEGGPGDGGETDALPEDVMEYRFDPVDASPF